MKHRALADIDSHADHQHPGSVLRNCVLPAIGLSVSQAARELQVSRQTLHRILDGTASLTPEIALRIETLTGVPSMFWLRLQCARDLDRIQSSRADILARIPRHILPRSIMKQIGALDGR